jgi:hypothetical protein
MRVQVGGLAKGNINWLSVRFDHSRRKPERVSVETLYIEPDAPWENGYEEAFQSRLRDEFLDVEEFGSVGEAKTMAKAYSRIEMACIQASQQDLLLMTLRTRFPQTDDETLIQMLGVSEGSLGTLTVLVVHNEFPAWKVEGAMRNAPEIYAEMIEVVYEVTPEYAPGA